jgi:hypothetical protein
VIRDIYHDFNADSHRAMIYLAALVYQQAAQDSDGLIDRGAVAHLRTASADRNPH